MFKFVAFRNIKRVGNSFLANHCSEVKKNGALIRSFTLCKANVNHYNTSAQNLSLFSRRNTSTHHAQIAWKSLSRICSYSGPASPSSTMIACAVGLTLTRFHPVALGIYAFITRKLAWKKAWSEGGMEYLPASTLYRRTQVGHVSLSSFIYSVSEYFLLFMRAIYLAMLFSPTIAMALFADSYGVQFRKTLLRLVHVTLEKAGPAFITLGQWAATRPDLFPRDLCVELSKLEDKVQGHSFSYSKKTIEKAFGRKLSEIFDDFEETPVASGSLAHVHRATLRFRYPGKQVKPIAVAVKVRHPGIRELFKRDFVLIQSFTKILSFIPKLKWLKLNERLQHFEAFMTPQVDFSKKAALLTLHNYYSRKWNHASYPKPLYPLVHPAVLVVTYEKGEHLSCFIEDNIKLEEGTKNTLISAATLAFMKMFLASNFMHADTHPENILVRVDKGELRVIFLDVGMTAKLSRSERINLVHVFQAVGARDGRTAAKYTLKLSEKQNCPYPNAFIEDVEKSFNFWDTKEGGAINPLECMHRLLEKIRCHKVNIDDNVCTVITSVLTLESWQRKVRPRSVYKVMQTFHIFSSTAAPTYEIPWASERGPRYLEERE